MTRTLLPACLVALTAVAAATPARAEVHVDFLFGGGGYHHHYRPHYRYWGDYYWYAPPPPVRYVPIAPAPVVYVPTATVAPVVTQQVVAAPTAAYQTSVAQQPTLAPAAQTSAAPNIRTNSVPSRSTTREAANSVRRSVSVANPVGSGGDVSFVVDGSLEITLAPGETKTLDDGESYTVEFDRGDAYGTTRIVLDEGSYEFAVTPSGWDLQRRSSIALRTNVRRNTLPAAQPTLR